MSYAAIVSSYRGALKMSKLIKHRHLMIHLPLIFSQQWFAEEGCLVGTSPTLLFDMKLWNEIFSREMSHSAG